jgi:hypothetical protein
MAMVFMAFRIVVSILAMPALHASNLSNRSGLWRKVFAGGFFYPRSGYHDVE